MAPNPKVSNAFRAMRDMEIPDKTTKLVLKNLLLVYGNNWELIEDENYRVLVEAILDYEQEKEKEQKKRKESELQEESGPPLKRSCMKHQDEASPSSDNVSTLRGETQIKTEPDSVSTQRSNEMEIITWTKTCSRQARADIYCLQDSDDESDCVSPVIQLKDKGKKLLTPEISSRDITPSKRSNGICLKEPNLDTGPDFSPKEKRSEIHRHDALIKPKCEHETADAHFEAPISVSYPDDTFFIKSEGSQDELELVTSQKGTCKGDDTSKTGYKSADIPESSAANFEIASSAMGEVKVFLSCSSALRRADGSMPRLDAVLKMVENKYRKIFKISDPKFSVVKLLQELCHCFLEAGTNSVHNKDKGHVNVTPVSASVKNSSVQNHLNPKGTNGDKCNMLVRYSNGSPSSSPSGEVVIPKIPRLLPVDGLGILQHIIERNKKLLEYANSEKYKKQDFVVSESSNSNSLVVARSTRFNINESRPVHDKEDITKGEESVKIPFANDISNDPYPPSFYYIPQNRVYQNGYINFPLARIGDEDCCANCFGDCLSSSIPCACARETGGEFAYTPEGLVQKKFLDESISMSRDSENHSLFYCKDCPLERSKNEDSPEKCKGHLVRKFIKECWSKCGCHRNCGNRVVQRGITRSLQVFLTPEGKGWGLRTLEDLPRGAFVCEYVGEILTNTELYERNMRSTGNEKHTYPVLLDADWGSEGVLKDEEALCLDATFYGNVARFINHRCFDGNLVAIPVEIETPDHHYYHIAFFTSRKVDSLEELTWDYMIDFDDHEHPIKAFRCRCGSRGCRDISRRERSKPRSYILT